MNSEQNKTSTILKWNILITILCCLILLIALLVASCNSKNQNTDENKKESGKELFASVKKFVSLGEHRTGTPGDLETSAWLKSELDSAGFKTEYVEFPLKQFFFSDGNLTIGSTVAEVFPVWPVKDDTNLAQTGIVVDGDKLLKPSEVAGTIVFTRLKHVHGVSTPETVAQINPFIKAGALAVLALTENSTNEIVALNTFQNQSAWAIPVYHFAPKDSALILQAIVNKTPVSIKIKGNMQAINARNVLGKIGTGSKFVVVSTPISGWFTTGGERGPGIAVWLELAKWASKNIAQYPDYTFVFTGHSGHELSILGAHAFVDNAAPKPEDTKLWIHLGAAVAVREWKEENNKWVLTDSVDSKRGIYYSASVADAFEKSFNTINAKKVKGTEENKETVKPGGEGALFKERGYNNLVSIAHAHRLHHVRTDNEQSTSPELLVELEQALEIFISAQLANDDNKLAIIK